MQLWNIAKKRANSVNEAYAPTILADDLSELVGEAGEAITQEDREAIRDAFVETMADLQGKESKTTSIISTPKTPETVDTPTPEVAEFGGDSKDTGRKRSRPTNAAERRKAAREARAAEKAQEVQNEGDLGTPVKSIELFPGEDSSQQNTQQSSPQTENNTEAKEADVERGRQEIAEEGLQEVNQGNLTDSEIESRPSGSFKKIWGYLRGKIGGNVDDLISLVADPTDNLLRLNKVLSGVKISKIDKAYSTFINELEKQTNLLNNKLEERVNKGIRENYPQSSMDKLIKERDEKVAENNKILNEAKQLNAKYNAEITALEAQEAQESQQEESKEAEIKRIDKAIEKAKENKKKESDAILNSTRNKLKENGINDPAGALADISNKYEAEINKLQEEKDSLLDLNKAESTTNASKSKESTQDSHIPLTPVTQGLDNSKAIDNSIAEENKATANKETA